MGFHAVHFGLPRPFHSRVRSRHGTVRQTEYSQSFHNAPTMEVGHKNKLFTGRSVVGNCETGRVVVFDSVQTLCNPQAPVSVRLDVVVRKVDRFQCVVTRVERISVQDEGCVHGVRLIVFRINAEEVAILSDVQAWTGGFHQRVTLRTQGLRHVVPRTAPNQHEVRSVLIIRRQNNFVGRRHLHSLSGFTVHRSCNGHNN